MCKFTKAKLNGQSTFAGNDAEKLHLQTKLCFFPLQNSQLSITELLSCPRLSILVSFRFEDENEYEYEIYLKVLTRILKKDTSERFILVFFTKKVSRVIYTKEG